MQNVGTQPRSSKDGRGYGGKWKKWLAVYLVAGAVVYAIVYFAFLHHGGGSGGGGGGYALLPLPGMRAFRRSG